MSRLGASWAILTSYKGYDGRLANSVSRCEILGLEEYEYLNFGSSGRFFSVHNKSLAAI